MGMGRRIERSAMFGNAYWRLSSLQRGEHPYAAKIQSQITAICSASTGYQFAQYQSLGLIQAAYRLANSCSFKKMLGDFGDRGCCRRGCCRGTCSACNTCILPSGRTRQAPHFYQCLQMIWWHCKKQIEIILFHDTS